MRKQVTHEEIVMVLERAIKDPEIAKALFGVYSDIRDGKRQLTSQHTKDQHEVQAAVRAALPRELALWKRALRMIDAGHSFNKRFEALRDFSVMQAGRRVRIESGSQFDMVGHGWHIKKSGDRETHHQALEVRRPGDDTMVKIDITDRTLTRLLTSGKLRAMP